MNLKEAMLEIIWVVEAWGNEVGGLKDTEREALKVITAHCQPYIGTINAMQGRQCFNVTQKMEKGDD